MPRIDSTPASQYMMSLGRQVASRSMKTKPLSQPSSNQDSWVRGSHSRKLHAALPDWYKKFQDDLAQAVQESIADRAVVRKIHRVGSLSKAGLEAGAVLATTLDTLAESKAAGEAIAHTPELAKRVQDAIKSGGSWHGTLRLIDDTLLVIRIGAAGYSIQRAKPGQKLSTAATEAGSMVGSAGGGFLGGAFGKHAGAGVGGLLGGAVGAVVGAAVGAIGFCLVGSFFGGKGGEVAGKELHPSIDEFIHHPPVPKFERVSDAT